MTRRMNLDSRIVSGLAGAFVVLDGPEGCGKTTQARRLAERLASAGVACALVRDPGSTRIGEQIRRILLEPEHREMAMRCEMLLYMAARAQMTSELIRPALQAGKLVICDRFISSTLAYQLGGEGLTAADIRAVGDVATGGRWPDLTIILDMPVEASLARLQRSRDRIEQRGDEYHRRVRQNYLDQAAADPAGYRVIAADRTVDDVHASIWAEVMALGARRS